MQIGGHKGIKSEKNYIFRHFEFNLAEKFEKYLSWAFLHEIGTLIEEKEPCQMTPKSPQLDIAFKVTHNVQWSSNNDHQVDLGLTLEKLFNYMVLIPFDRVPSIL
jgi:hypothetical protein